ncbi:TetR family transcriptional regulator C-terminal domain-containing protein [Aureimonas mangrovi]|uniref:TetR family transcriptional regulator C-terminal domain-containing protein n=1 Tax=Aureimonas mangrovi TaxID=2758041 RepID=UPI00163DBF8B|nr:TetR family transcriptional regulator C-terminal domain-containing protein [Aureimonas mangrovi]
MSLLGRDEDEAAARTPTRIQAANRELILEAALPVFSAHGFKGATLDEIARAASMSKPNLLYYFRRKQDIYAAVLERTLEAWLAPLEALDPAGDPVAELTRYIRAKMRLSARKPEASRLFANEILHGAPVVGGFLKTRLKTLVEEKAAVLSRWMENGKLARVDPVHLVFMIWAMTQHYADFEVQVRAILGPRADARDFAEEAAEAVIAIVLGGVRPR